MTDFRALCQICGKATDILHEGVCFDCAAAQYTRHSISAEWLDASAIPTEAEEQRRLFIWADLHTWKWPELNDLYHIPNEGKRSRVTGARMKQQGLKNGVPDLCLPVARCGCHALYIELKRMKGGKPTKDQLDWINRLTRNGNMALVCEGWEPAAKVLEDYLEGRL